MTKKEYKYIPAEVGMASLVNVIGTPPYTYGNYFSFRGGPRCINMWTENLTAAKYQFLLDGLVGGWLYTVTQKGYNDKLIECSWFVVDDKRIPEEYINDELYFTGYYLPKDKTVLRDMFEIHGDSLNQYYQMIEDGHKYFI